MERADPLISAVRVLIAARDHPKFFEKIKEAFEEASGPRYPVTVENWYGVMGNALEAVDCAALVVASEAMLDRYPDEELHSKLESLLPMLIGADKLFEVQTIVWLHDSEIALIETMADAFDLDPQGMQMVDTTNTHNYYSFRRDFQISLACKRQGDKKEHGTPWFRAAETASKPGQEKPPAQAEAKPVETKWYAVIGETSEETADVMASYLSQKALRQNLNVTVVPHSSVEDVVAAVLGRKPFAVSLPLHLLDKNLANGGKLVEWSALRVLPHAARRGVPVVLSTNCTPRQIQGALNQLRIKEKPAAIVSPDRPLKWAETMLGLLMTKQ